MADHPIKICRFGEDDPLTQLADATTQVKYLRSYLSDIDAESVICEPRYFDRDYLAEFAAFYSTSAQMYKNSCKRAHFFRGNVSRTLFESAVSGDETAIKRLQKNYLGFIVFRPIPAAPLGRTVLEWYKDESPLPERIRNPKRTYKVHIAGIKLKISGLAWQQQDHGVGACATIGLWSMLHSSAFDDRHAIPTTADVTESAHLQASLGDRVFPSTGLHPYQIGEAIKAQNLAPVTLQGELADKDKGIVVGFGLERFASTCASFIRSGYPVLIVGDREDDAHAVCAVGFRPASKHDKRSAETALVQDIGIPYLYLHDDNIGPNVKFEITEKRHKLSNGKYVKRVVLVPKTPSSTKKHPAEEKPDLSHASLVPEQLIVAVHDDLRTSPDVLHKAGHNMASKLHESISVVAKYHGQKLDFLVFSTRFVKLADYLGRGLRETVDFDNEILKNIRLGLAERAPAMSLHLGLLRIASPDGELFLDVLYDTTDSDKNHPVFATVVYQEIIRECLDVAEEFDGLTFGTIIDGF